MGILLDINASQFRGNTLPMTKKNKIDTQSIRIKRKNSEALKMKVSRKLQNSLLLYHEFVFIHNEMNFHERN